MIKIHYIKEPSSSKIQSQSSWHCQGYTQAPSLTQKSQSSSISLRTAWYPAQHACPLFFLPHTPVHMSLPRQWGLQERDSDSPPSAGLYGRQGGRARPEEATADKPPWL